METTATAPGLWDELRSIVGAQHVYTEMHHRLLRSATPSPFPIHRWDDHAPDVVVMPASRDEVVEIVRFANRHKIPVVPRGAGTGLADGAVPLRGGILLDIKRMCEILELDEENMCVTVQPGINMQELNKVLAKLGLWYPDDPASYSLAVIGGRIGTGGWSLIGSGWGHVPDLIISMEVVLPTGDVIRVGEGGGGKVRKSSVGYRLKDLFMGHQGTLGIVTEATLDLAPRPEAEFAAYFGFSSFEEVYRCAYRMGRSGLKTLSGIYLFDEEKVEFLRRDDEAYIPASPEVKSVLGTVCYGTEAEVSAARERIFRIAKAGGGSYLGRRNSESDWASRHERYHIPFHGRRPDGQVVLLSWHCEDAAIPYSALPEVRRRWHEIARKYHEMHPDLFEDWGMFFLTNNPFKPWGDYLAELDLGLHELAFSDKTWATWVQFKREIAEVAVEVGGSVSSCHGGTRAGDVEVACRQELAAGQFELMKKIKRTLDPNNIMNPGKYLLDEAYGEVVTHA